MEFVIAGDVPTLEAALKLYQQVAGLLIEKKPKADLPNHALQLAAELLPHTPRVVLVDYEATGGVHTAVSCGLATRLVLIPFSDAELSEAIGVEPEEKTASSRLNIYPPLTGGIRASSSPPLSR